jgi:hypothetical protein
MIPPTINDFGGAPVATHEHACAVCLKRPSVHPFWRRWYRAKWPRGGT